jgi:inosine/guanosine/xanthosine phosphorylase family protein
MGTNPLIGANDERIGPRFLDMGEVYDPALRAVARRAAEQAGIALAGGVYLALTGPPFETPAEIRAWRRLGADLVGMSTVPEAISARHCGLRVLAISMVTNLAAGMTGEPLGHAGTLEQAGRAAPNLLRLLEGALPEIADALA